MATSSKKGRSSRDGERKSSKRTDESSLAEEKREESLLSSIQGSPVEEESHIEEPPAPREPTPEPVYEEPPLTKLVVENYDGEKERGLYHGHGEAWYVGGHHYKGQWKQGMMHGKGCYSWKDNLIYEGEFSWNKVTGKGTYKWADGSSFEGELLDGLRHGFGTFRCADGKMSYTGDWHKGKKHGKGRIDYDPEGASFYEGDWVGNAKHGWGARCYPSGNIYQGMWFNNIRHGDGTMRWLNRDQMYTGQWENATQHGQGQHIWFLRRIPGSQYPLRNMYDGEFDKGMRSGTGTFYYANGARYEGLWKDNMKHGKGKFIFKNGRVYEGTFDRDHIVEFPNFEMDAVSLLASSDHRPFLDSSPESLSIQSNSSRNTYSPSFQLEVDHLLQELPESDREEEATQVIFVMMRHITALRKIYSYYSSLGYEESPDNTFVMNRMQFWRFLKDCKLHHYDTSLMEIDRVLGVAASLSDDPHNPYGKILFREFTNYMVSLAYHIFHKQHEGVGCILHWCLSKLMADNVLSNACSVNGFIYRETRRAVNALVHMDQAYEIYKQFCMARKTECKELSMKMRELLFMIKDVKLINSDLTPKAIVDILASDDPKVLDDEGAINMEPEITFLEFFETLVGCAEVFVTESVVKDPNTPRLSPSVTHEPSVISMPQSPSRVASQMEEGAEEGTFGASSPVEGGGATPRSSSQMTTKTDHGSLKAQTIVITTSEAAELPDSAKKSEITLNDGKKSASFMSSHSGMTDGGNEPLVHSVVCMAHSEASMNHQGSINDEDDETYDEELDEETRQFNFWTHQVHIFFVRKFFPSAQKLILLNQLIHSRTG
ncbi:hypothetical protein CAPTEDRAFT_180366 [Capitella teleta]|uniref:Radial spoke head 10 homolog B2 n=1 Tax=Capitella teleta TaxID=283909 RepID=R7UYD4_CAPTE|nr:hypothetical protein CAPTEDRAFT_180366 [Capitella teleta]|eukprot:ELU11324.1 hypothetical protein CAPTEDRAFT_180366 [Capitella teleta]